jgi:hypothetical protein
MAGTTKEELEEVIQPQGEKDGGIDDHRNKKPKKTSRIISLIKGTTKGGVNIAISADRMKAAVGSKGAKDRLGVVRAQTLPPTGPIRFPARYNGKKGHAYITTTATTPALSWTTALSDLSPAWNLMISDIIVRINFHTWASSFILLQTVCLWT